jgi:stringent starvation protein B
MTEVLAMSSNRPYLLRALYEWVGDNGLTPYILVDATLPQVRVPPGVVKDGKVVLNIAMRAVEKLEMGNEALTFSARFSGASQYLYIPVAAVIAIYAQETGQGMMLPADEVRTAQDYAEQSGQETYSDAGDGLDQQTPESEPEPKPPGPNKGGHLRIVK